MGEIVMVSGVLYHLGGKKILQISVCVCVG